MPTTKRRRRHARERFPLTNKQRWDLLLGGPSVFPNDQERREAWVRNRVELMQDHDFPHARICYELGGFLPHEGGRITRAVDRLKRSGVLPTENPKEKQNGK